MITVLTKGRLLDCVGDKPLEDASVVIEDGDIKDVYSGEKPLPQEATVIDVGGRTIMPGLTDAHMHIAYTHPSISMQFQDPPIVTAVNATVTTTYATPLQALSSLKQWQEVFEKHSDKLIQVTTAQDIERAKREGKLGIIMGSQNAAMIGDDINLLTIYKKLGLRIIQLSYYEQNLLGEGCGERTNGGLTTFGVEVVEEMNRLRLLIDISHCGDRVVMDAIKFSKVPIVATHANPRALVNHPRNKTDEHIKAIADKGGVIGMLSYSRISQAREGIQPDMEDLLNFIDYTVKLVGPDHVGIGTDVTPFWSEEAYEEWAQFYPDLRSNWGWTGRDIFTNKEGDEDISRMVEITKGLVAQGYSDEDIQKIIGLNFLRVFREVWGE